MTRLPALNNRVCPGPGGLDFIVAHEQGLIAPDHIHNQPFICIRRIRVLTQSFGKAHVERHIHQTHAAGTGFLDGHAQIDALIGLQLNTEFIVILARLRAENRMRRLFEHHVDFTVPGLQPFAGAQIKRRAMPAPIADMGLERHKTLGP